MADQDSTTKKAEGAAREAKQHAAAGAEALQRGAEAEAQKWTSQVGARSEHVAEAVREAGERLRGKEDWLADGADAVSKQLSRLSESARAKDPGELKADVEQFARERPAVFLGAAVAAGLALGRVLRSSAPSGEPGEPSAGPGSRSADEHGAGPGGPARSPGQPATQQSARGGPSSEKGRF